MLSAAIRSQLLHSALFSARLLVWKLTQSRKATTSTIFFPLIFPLFSALPYYSTCFFSRQDRGSGTFPQPAYATTNGFSTHIFRHTLLFQLFSLFAFDQRMRAQRVHRCCAWLSISVPYRTEKSPF